MFLIQSPEFGELFHRMLHENGSSFIRMTEKDGSYVVSIVNGTEHYPSALGISGTDAFAALNMALAEVAKQQRLVEEYRARPKESP